MYNMEISAFGMKCRVEILILVVILFWIMWGHVLCSCSTVNAKEAINNMSNAYNELLNKKTLNYETNKQDIPMIGINHKEGFTPANINNGESSKFSVTADDPPNTSSWFSPDLSYKKGTSGGPGVQEILNRQAQPIPLPEGELLMFANTPFKPECCPNSFSNSTGCACMTVDQYNYLINRGGNNVPYSEY
uniref:Uncharacterized protein n=1 Tax=viral metagenome TaxID=1070528 RepID=A0A6C0B0C5_9ZZZZ